MFQGTLLDPFPQFSTPFTAPAPNPMSTPSLLYPSMSSNPAAPQGDLLFGRLVEQSPLTGYEPKSLIEVSSEQTTTNVLTNLSAPSHPIPRVFAWRG